ncbi:MAG TPA: hypothetical protein VHX44_16665 [Planctomycetota bacterium]|nr:hypothetical protein [Planctomycetota bacterium]
MRTAAFLFLLLSMAGRADAGEQWTATISVNTADGKPSACHLWLPDGAKRIRAIFLFTSYGSFGGFAAGPQIRELGRDLECGVVLSEDRLPDKDPAPMLANLQTLATRSAHPEVAYAPLFVFGHSNSTYDMGRFAALVPTRIAGWVAMKSAFGLQFSEPELYRIPGMVVSGEADQEYFGDQPATVLKLRREHGALVHMLIEAGGPHWPNDPTFEIMMAFLKNVFYLRVPSDGDATLAPIKLVEVAEAEGWLGQSVAGKRVPIGGKWMWEQPTDVKRLLEIAPFADFPGDAKDASWLPSADYARKWQEYCHTVALKDWARLPPGTVEAWSAKRRPPVIDGLESTLLAAQVKRLAAATGAKPVIEELRKLAAGTDKPDEAAEATRVLGVLEKLSGDRLTQAKRLEATHPPSAVVAYQAVVKRFDGLAAADSARERLKAKDLKREVTAWATLDRLIQLDGSLVAVDGATRSATDQHFAAANSKRLLEIHQTGNGMLREFADTLAAKEVLALLTRLGIPVAGEKVAEKAGNTAR